MKKLTILGLAAALVLASNVASHAGSREGKIGIHGNFDFNTVGMSDMNDYLALQGATYVLLGATNVSVDKASSGIGGGGAVTYGFTPNIEAELGFDFLSTSGDVNFTDPSTGTAYKDTISLPLFGITIGGAYVFPDVTQGLDLKIGLRVAYDMISGGKYTPGFPGTTGADLTGSGVGFGVLVGGEYFMTPEFSLGLNLGYDIASLTPITQSSSGVSSTAKNASGNNIAADYSGLAVQVGVSYYFSSGAASK